MQQFNDAETFEICEKLLDGYEVRFKKKNDKELQLLAKNIKYRTN